MIATRDELFAALEQMPLQGLYASAANFVLVRVEKHRKLGEWLRRKGILVRDVSKYPMLENCLRLSVGTPEENAALIGALQEYFAG
jgi:histidinol-phosphate/aromatic aminotransferase/cobyric acid decarboxylase-like protein